MEIRAIRYHSAGKTVTWYCVGNLLTKTSQSKERLVILDKIMSRATRQTIIRQCHLNVSDILIRAGIGQ